MPSFLRTSAGTEIWPWAVTLDWGIDIWIHYQGNVSLSMNLRRQVVISKARRSPVSGTGHRGPLACRCHIGVRPTWPHGLALAGTAAFFTRKSHAAIYVAGNYLICKQSPYASDIFDSHHPLNLYSQLPPTAAHKSGDARSSS